jgi:hypothetical protein
VQYEVDTARSDEGTDKPADAPAEHTDDRECHENDRGDRDRHAAVGCLDHDAHARDSLVDPGNPRAR